ncbi:MAG: ABC transporter permease [Chloroflexota bacterium]|nr:MAG: ABC transporter permease [Chloroflexota bacterium]
MTLLRELGRRKLRTSLTVLGITIGIWALVVFSSMANKINSFVASGSDYYVGKVIVSDGSSTGIGLGLVPIDLAIADQISALSGVAAVDPQVQVPYEDVGFGGFSMPRIIVGAVAGADNGRASLELQPALGRALTADDEGSRVAVLGSDLARELGAAIGEDTLLRGVPFEVVGILQPTLSAPDTTAMVPLSAAQELFLETLPPQLASALQPSGVASQIVVHADDGTDAAALADRIEATVEHVTTMTSADFDQQVGSTTLIFNAIIIGVAVISLVVGGLSVINTMAMSVTERTREIGIKRAIGGSRRRIIHELVAEAALIGLIGGVIGLGLGAIVVLLANEAGRPAGTILFDLTPGTALFAVAFSTILGMAAGVVPAWNAARLDPVAALRYE